MSLLTELPSLGELSSSVLWRATYMREGRGEEMAKMFAL